MTHPCADRPKSATGCLVASLAMLLFWALVVWLLAGCACPPQEYRTVPAWSIPAKPPVETVQADALQCLSDDAYLRLAKRDRACWRYAGELRALLGPEP
jgi:hypothetical protein